MIQTDSASALEGIHSAPEWSQSQMESWPILSASEQIKELTMQLLGITTKIEAKLWQEVEMVEAILSVQGQPRNCLWLSVLFE